LDAVPQPPQSASYDGRPHCTDRQFGLMQVKIQW